ncbi:uncharacterized protein LOC121386042 [Gigantopelta aegis]|uniref:uncharacterized protein LOC121386042 n=1 Tax=Gigantopelta aegis TaxID=1735272 RepID=UPI001B888EB8|nr:uncharacterized protein LOC121386042 [Gigantopelta aegis]
MANTTDCNLDVFAEEFPDDVDVSELCDCGRHKRMSRPKYVRNKEEFPETDYMSTFKAVQYPRPRSSKRPPPSPRDPNPKPMVFETNQRDEFKTYQNYERTKPIIREDHYEPPTVPIEGKTSYQKEFTAKELCPEIQRVSPRQGRLKVSSAKFHGVTTTQEHYKQWVPQPSMTFGELPSFTGSVLFPQKEALPQSVMRASYPGVYQKPEPPFKGRDPSLKLEGDMSFFLLLPHNDTFQDVLVGDPPCVPFLSKMVPDIPLLQNRGNFDFAGWTQTNFDTEQRATFKGHDVVIYPAPTSCKQADDYKPPDAKFASETSQMRDFKPIELSDATQTRAIIPPTHMHMSDVKFESKTSNNEFFQNWGTKPRVRYGDFHDNRPYVPPQSKFEGASVTQSTFTTKKAEPTKSYKPEQKAASAEGRMDYGTSYSDTYTKKEIRMCRAQMYLMQQELKRRRKANQNPEMSNSLVFAK